MSPLKSVVYAPEYFSLDDEVKIGNVRSHNSVTELGVVQI